MLSGKKTKPQLIEEIISEARARTRGHGALTAEAAVLEAARKFEKNGLIKSSAWGDYVKKATEKLLSRLKKDKEAKNKEPLESAQEARRRRKHAQGMENAAWARRDQEVLDAEASEEELSELRARYQNIRK